MDTARRLNLVLLVALLAAACGCAVLDRTPDPQPVAKAFASDLRNGRVDGADLVRPGDADAAVEMLADVTDELTTSPSVGVIGPVEVIESTSVDGTATRALAHLRISWELPTGTWAYDARLPLLLVDNGWKVDWSSTIVHPRLGDGRALRLRTTAPARGPILSADGRPLFRRRPVVTVYVQPRRMRSAEQVARAAHRILGVDRASLQVRVDDADPDELVEVITLRMDDYAPLRATLQPVPGLVFRRGDLPLTPDRAFARSVLGRVGPATAEVLEEAGFGFDAADTLGLWGLQRRFQRALAGTPGVKVEVVEVGGEPVQTPHRTRPEDGEALRTTLDPSVQRAADHALSTVGGPSALVALRASTGEVLAVANGPDGGSENRAFTGRYPPGSTFKVVSGAALLVGGMEPGTRVHCPRSATVGGRTFTNAGGFALGTTTLRGAFVRSCNTAFVQLADGLDDGAIMTTADVLGFGGTWYSGIDAYTGQVPAPEDDVERAATTIGQARVLVSPLVMASVAAAVQDGTWRPPTLLPDHAAPGDTPPALDPYVLPTMRRMMRGVVTDGTGRALASVPGPPVRAKTGTAEYGSADPPRTHAWVIAARADVAVAVLVEDGGGGAEVAAPVAARFFRSL
ncbi:MAG TPA: penicillin-binding transpeptidase domain-containing protein [Euzebyales bacterium]|nr:penicillin-binding transpeptidase domain-containing protein [Euzebyales bacterium]